MPEAQFNPPVEPEIINFPGSPDWFNKFRSPLTLDAFNISYPDIGYYVVYGGNTGVQCEILDTDRGVKAELHFKPDGDITLPTDQQIGLRNTKLFAAGFYSLADYITERFPYVISINGFAKTEMFGVVQRYISQYPNVFKVIPSERKAYPFGYKIDIDEFVRLDRGGFQNTMLRKTAQKVAAWSDVELINPRLQLKADKDGYFTYFDPD